MSSAKVFAELEQAQPGTAGEGFLERRITTQSGCGLYLSVRRPGGGRRLRVDLPTGVPVNESQLPELKTVGLRAGPSTQGGQTYTSVLLELRADGFEDLFAALADDLEAHLAPLTSDGAVWEALRSRLAKWQRFMEKTSPEGLSPEQQRGLFGELTLLSRLVEVIGPAAAVGGWHGPGGAPKDFSFPPCSFEVKSTCSKQHERLHISNELQLDDSGTAALLLYHLSLEETENQGVSLASLVDDVRLRCGSAWEARVVLDDKLLAAGYLDLHRARYVTPAYHLRGEHFYRVVDGFPRLVSKDIPPGVGDLKYTINVSECLAFSVESAQVWTLLQGVA